jgi:flagellar hook-length control protein FliK
VLGELRFDVRIVGKVVLIHAFVETEQAAAALALAVSTLREKLEAHGLVLGRLDVTTVDDKQDQRKPNSDHHARRTREKNKKNDSLPLPSLGRLDESREDDGQV